MNSINHQNSGNVPVQLDKKWERHFKRLADKEGMTLPVFLRKIVMYGYEVFKEVG